MYLVTLRLSAQSSTVVSSISSTVDGLRTVGRYRATPPKAPGMATSRVRANRSTVRLFAMAEPTFDDIDALVGPATPHFAYQLRARVRELIEDLPAEHPVRSYGEEKLELLDRLGHASSLAQAGEREPRTRIGWETIPSSAPAYEPLPKGE